MSPLGRGGVVGIVAVARVLGLAIGLVLLAVASGCRRNDDARDREQVGAAALPAMAVLDASTSYSPGPDASTSGPSPTCVTIQRGKSGKIADTYIDAKHIKKNYGNEDILRLDKDDQALLQFDLSAIPTAASVTSATLRLYVEENTSRPPVTFHAITTPWTENTVTWSSFHEQFQAAVSAVLPEANPGPNNSVDLATLVQQWISGQQPNDGVLAETKPSPSDCGVTFASSESGPRTAPALTVCYLTGPCAGKPDGTACDDGNPCTAGDACHSGTCSGNPVTCTALDQCHQAGACNPTTGTCSNPTLANGTPCNDGNACTQTDTCQSGTCTGSNPVTCTALDQCHQAGACDPTTGTCSNPTVVDGTACNDGNACTQTDTCLSGLCTGSNPVVCVALDQCHQAGACDPTSGTCSSPTLANGTACNDGNACTQTDTCQGGACVGSNPVTCTALDQCHLAGTCNPTTGACSNPTATNGSTCNLGNACFQTQTCQSGTCTGSNPVTCMALDQCHLAGTCNPTTGTCSSPTVTNGTACNLGNACMQTQTCQGGTCVGSNPVTCTALDQCHQAGTCDPTSGACSNPTVADGTTCNAGNACMKTQTCQGGTCVGSNPVVCAALDQCHAAGTCDPTAGTCSNPTVADGTACNDNNACTQTDACQAGACVGSNPITCTASDPCHGVGTCDPTSGACSNPALADGTVCSDGMPCTTGDACLAGACAGTPVPTCIPPGSTDDTVFETDASIFGIALSGGAAVPNISVSVYDDVTGSEPVLRNDVLLFTQGDGSFRVRLTAFPTSVPQGSAAFHEVLQVQAPGVITAVREVYLRPGVAADVGTIQLMERDPQVTVIGPGGGTATDSQNLVEVVIPPGALSQSIPVQITPFATRDELPMPLPPQTITTYAFELEPNGTEFSTPVTVRMANTRDLPTAMQIPVGSADRTRALWMPEGTATWDGTRFAYTTTHFSMHDTNGSSILTQWIKILFGGADPNNSDKTCSGSAAGLANGDASQLIPLVSYQRQNRTYGVQMVYDGYQAGPTILQAEAQPSHPTASLPSSGIAVPTAMMIGYEQCVAASQIQVVVCGGAPPGVGGGSGGSNASCTPGTTRLLQSGMMLTFTPVGASAPGQVSAPVGAGAVTAGTQAILPVDDSGNLVGPSFQLVHVTVQEPGTAPLGSGGPFGGVADCLMDNASTAYETGAFGYDRYVFVPHRNNSPFGVGWSPDAIHRLYVDPSGAQAVLLHGDSSTETFRPRAFEVDLTTTTDLFTGTQGTFARDPLTGELFLVGTPTGNVIEQVTINGTTEVSAAVQTVPSLTTQASTMAIAYVGAVRHFVVATTTGLWDVPQGGTAALLMSRGVPHNQDIATTLPQVAATGSTVYYNDGLNSLNTVFQGAVLYRFKLDVQPVVAEALTPVTGGELGIDHSALLGGVQFSRPAGLTAAPDGGLYLIDRSAGAVYALSPGADGTVGTDSVVRRVVGDGFGGWAQPAEDKIPGRLFSLPDPLFLAVAPDNSLWIINTFGAAVWTPDPVRPFEGDARWLVTSAGGTAEIQSLFFNQQVGLLAESSQSLLAYNKAVLRRYAVDLFSSAREPQRTIAFDTTGAATLTDTGADTYEFYDAKGRLTGVQERSGMPIYSVSYVAGTSRPASIVDPTGDMTTFTYDASGHISTITDPANRPTSLVVNSAGDLVSITNPANDTDSFAYKGHKLTSKTSPRGDITQYVYNDNGTLTSVKRPDNTTLQFSPAYTRSADNTGTFTGSYTDTHGVVHTFSVDTWGNRSTETYVADGVSYTHTWIPAQPLFYNPAAYDLTGKFQNQLSARNNVIGRITVETLNDIYVGRQFSFDGYGRVAGVGVPVGSGGNGLEAYAYDANGRLYDIALSGGGSGLQLTYNTAGQLVSATGLQGGTTSNPNQQQPPVGGAQRSWTYLPNGLVSTFTIAGVTTTYTYDAKGNVASISDGSGRVLSFQRNSAGLVTMASDGTTFTNFSFDSANRLVNTVDALNNTTTYTYERAQCGCADDDLVTAIHTPDLPANEEWSFAYGLEGRLATAVDPTGGAWNFTYAPTGEITQITDPLNRIEKRTYDSLGRLSTVLDALGRARGQSYLAPTNTGWTGSGLLAAGPSGTAPSTSTTAVLGNGQYQIGTIALDAAPAGQATGLWTQGVPVVTAYQDATFGISYAYAYSYDLTGREVLSQERDRTGVAPSAPPDFTSNLGYLPTSYGGYFQGNYGYWDDTAGAHAAGMGFGGPGAQSINAKFLSEYIPYLVVDGFGGTNESYTRDAFQRITQVQLGGSEGALARGAALFSTVTYRSDGRLATRVDRIESSGLFLNNTYNSESYTYDQRGLLATRQVANEGTYTYSYDAVGRSSTLQYPDGHQRVQVFDGAGRIMSRCYEYPGTSVATRCYTAEYDPAGTPTKLVDPEGTDMIGTDPLTRLTSVSRLAKGATNPVVENYAYNSIGALSLNNRVTLDSQRPRLDGNGLADSPVPNTLNGQPITVDPGGRITALGGVSFQPNARGLVVQTTDSSGPQSYFYDVWLRRMAFVPSTATAATTSEYYVYGDPRFDPTIVGMGVPGPMGVANIEARFVGQIPPGTGVPTETYLFDGVDHPLRIKQGSTVAYYELDLAGNVRRLRGPGGTDLGGYRYTAFGEAYPADSLTPAATINQPLRWKGRWLTYSANLGAADAIELYDMRGRWWCPLAGVFLGIDALAYYDSASTFWGWPGQNSLKQRDPSGHDAVDDAFRAAKRGEFGSGLQQYANAFEGRANGIAMLANAATVNAGLAQIRQSQCQFATAGALTLAGAIVDIGIAGLDAAEALQAEKAIAKYEHHHVLPLDFQQEFREIGIELNELHDYTLRLPVDLHKEIHWGNGFGWNHEWEEFIHDAERGRYPTREEAFRFAEKLIYDYNIEEYLPYVRHPRY